MVAKPKRIGLVACCKTKAATRHPARFLYRSQLFKMALQYAVLTCDEVYILSAKYGLVALDQQIEPYELTLNGMGKQERLQWAKSIKLPPGQYVYFAGARYREFLPPGEVPMQGLKIGHQLQWLKEKLKSAISY